MDLSVVIPYYNQPRQLRGALGDLCSQEGISLEAIVVDDCSEKSCADVVAEFQDNGFPVTLLRQPVRSYTLAARLKGMSLASGRWLAFMDADDGLCSPDAFAAVVREADALQCDVLHYGTMNLEKDGSLSPRLPSAPFHSAPLRGADIFKTWLSLDCKAHSVWNKLYSKPLYARVAALNHDVPIKRIEDFYLSAHFLFFAQTYAPSLVPVYKYSPPQGTHLEKAAARGIDAMRMFIALPGRFKEFGLPEPAAVMLRNYLRKMLTLNIGTMLAFLKRGGLSWSLDDFDQDGLRAILKYGSPRDYALALSICNAVNGAKMRKICHKLI